MFEWEIELEKTKDLKYKSHTYTINTMKIQDSYRIDLIEDEKPIILENSSNKSFLNIINKTDLLSNQIIHWGNNIIENQYAKCDKCKEDKILWILEKYDTDQKEFSGLKNICKSCRDEINNSIFEVMKANREVKDKEFEDYLKKNPPVILGGFKNRIEAYKIITNHPDKSIEESDSEFISAKAILKANDGTFYPVICTIDKSSGGELWDSSFIAKNYDELIPQDFIFPYINKTTDQVFPYTYETLSIVEEDFHQDSWFGTITQSNVKHHLSNLINIRWPEEMRSVEKTGYISVRTYFSIQHLLSVFNIMNDIKNYENQLINSYTEDLFTKHRGYCTNAIFSSVAFLEASINELFMDSKDNRAGLVRDLSDAQVQSLKGMWELGIPRTASYNIIDKYQIAKTLLQKDKIDLSIEPAQSVSIIIKLRNSLTHYEPEWVVTQNSEEVKSKQQKMERFLNGKFELNKFTGEDNPFFPDKCLSYGLINWTLKSIIDFADNFFIDIGIIPPYEKVRHKITSI